MPSYISAPLTTRRAPTWQVMPLCTKQRIAADYASLNRAELKRRDGTTLHLFSSLLSLLLRLTSHGEASEKEIARRTKEVRDPSWSWARSAC